MACHHPIMGRCNHCVVGSDLLEEVAVRSWQR
jgi:hypothetical protein